LQRSGRITVSAKQVGDEVQIAVHDTGVRIPPQHKTHIFDPFYRLDKSRSCQTGRGSIWMESAGEGQGITLTFSLPIAK
jgi:signal transduction histidine kinase